MQAMHFCGSKPGPNRNPDTSGPSLKPVTRYCVTLVTNIQQKKLFDNAFAADDTDDV